MALRLSVISEHGTHLGARSTKVFDAHGGTIGRGTDNDWSLPDPERYLSVKHARVDFRAGRYVLIDTSSNGTFVNGAPVPLGKHCDYTLQDGDFVSLGDYRVLVSIDEPDGIAQPSTASTDSADSAASADTPWYSGPSLLEQLETGELRHVDIQKNNRGIEVADFLKRFEAVRASARLVPLLAEDFLERLADVGVVFDDEDRP